MSYAFEQLRTLAEERLPDVAAAWAELIRAFRDAPDEDGNAEDAGNLSGFRV